MDGDDELIEFEMMYKEVKFYWKEEQDVKGIDRMRRFLSVRDWKEKATDYCPKLSWPVMHIRGLPF